MSRIKRGTTSNKRRRNILKKVKGYRFGRSTKESAAREAIVHAGAYAFAHRRDKKNVMRRHSISVVGSALKADGASYSKTMGTMKKKGLVLNRKMLALLAKDHPAAFKAVIASL